MNMRNFNYTMMTIIVMMMSIILFSSCKKSFAELNAEHEAKRSAIEKKLTKKFYLIYLLSIEFFMENI